MVLCPDLDHVVEVTLNVGLKRHVHLDAEPSCYWPLHVEVTFKLVSLGLRELKSTDLLANVTDRNSHFIVLMCLDIYRPSKGEMKLTFEENLRREHLYRGVCISKRLDVGLI